MAGLWEIVVYFTFSLLPSDIYPVPFDFSCRFPGGGLRFTHTQANTWVWWQWKWDFPVLCTEHEYIAVQRAVGLLSFCSVLLAALYYKAISLAVGEGVVIKDLIFPSPYGAILQSVCPAIPLTINRAMLLSPPCCQFL